jgi:hypothetical protein
MGVTTSSEFTAEASLGARYKEGFNSCGHRPLEQHQFKKEVLNPLLSGDKESATNGLHQAAGHTPGRVITTELQAHYAALTGAASRLGSDLTGEKPTQLLLGAQLAAAIEARNAGQPTNPELIRKLYEVARPKLEGLSFTDSGFIPADANRGVTLAALKASSKPDAADSFLGELLGDNEINREIKSNSPSETRKTLILAAPSHPHPLLLRCYELAIRHGSDQERSLALEAIKKVPERITFARSSGHAKMQEMLSSFAKSYTTALTDLTEGSQSWLARLLGKSSPTAQIPRHGGGVWSREDLRKLTSELRSATK